MQGQRIGYIRVSTLDQTEARQLEGIEVAKVFTDKASGKDAKRPQLEMLLSFVRTGDTVVVHSMDRLARNLDDLRRIVQTLTGRGIRIEFVKERLLFTGEDSPMANLMLSVMGAFAEFERALIHERQREGIALAKQPLMCQLRQACEKCGLTLRPLFYKYGLLEFNTRSTTHFEPASPNFLKLSP